MTFKRSTWLRRTKRNETTRKDIKVNLCVFNMKINIRVFHLPMSLMSIHWRRLYQSETVQIILDYFLSGIFLHTNSTNIFGPCADFNFHIKILQFPLLHFDICVCACMCTKRWCCLMMFATSKQMRCYSFYWVSKSWIGWTGQKIVNYVLHGLLL